MSHLGEFLELSVSTADIRESADFWERLGFVHAPTGDIWSHRYALLTDGGLCLGLHEYRFDSPALTFVRPELAQHLPGLRETGVDFAFAKTGDDEFHEAGFHDPAGQMIALLEARTYSAPSEAPAATRIGRFAHFTLTMNDVERGVEFWADLGFAATLADDHGDVAGYGLALAILPGPGGRPPTLDFAADAIDTAHVQAADAGLAPGPLRAFSPTSEGFELVSPEGLRLRVTARGD